MTELSLRELADIREDMRRQELAKVAYEAYWKETGFPADDEPWESLSPVIQKLWIAIIDAVIAEQVRERRLRLEKATGVKL